MKFAPKTVLVAAFVFGFISTAALAQQWFTGSVDEAVAKANAEGKLVLVDFYSGG